MLEQTKVWQPALDSLRASWEKPTITAATKALVITQSAAVPTAATTMESLMPRSRIRVDHKVSITSPQMFSSLYAEIPIDKDDPRGREPLIRLESGVKKNLELTF